MTLKMPFFISPAYWVPRITISRVLRHSHGLSQHSCQMPEVYCVHNCFVFAHETLHNVAANRDPVHLDHQPTFEVDAALLL